MVSCKRCSGCGDRFKRCYCPKNSKRYLYVMNSIVFLAGNSFHIPRLHLHLHIRTRHRPVHHGRFTGVIYPKRRSHRWPIVRDASASALLSPIYKSFTTGAWGLSDLQSLAAFSSLFQSSAALAQPTRTDAC